MRAIDLFSGAGGLSRGLSDAGMEISLAIDSWRTAVETYSRNMSHLVRCMDLGDVDQATEELKDLIPDMIAGGPPCQDFSSAGKREEGVHANLTEAFAEIVARCKPRYVLMENVPRVRSSNAYQHAKALLGSQGYSFYERVLDANLCGVPQIRKRFFMFGWLGQKNAAGQLHEVIEGSLDSRRMTVKEFMKDEISISHYYRHPRNYSRRAVFSVHEPSPTIRGVNRPVPPSYKRNPRDSASPRGVRALTSFERSRIQTFPVDWQWSDSHRSLTKSDTELLIGNAVPVNLAKFVGTAILEAFCG